MSDSNSQGAANFNFDSWADQLLSEIRDRPDIEVLKSLLQCHSYLKGSARTEEQKRHAFKPLLIARCVFNSSVHRRPRSEIKRALASEEKRGWRSFESPGGTRGRPLGKASTVAGKWLEDVIENLTRDMTPQEREKTLDWLLEPGTPWKPGYLDKSPSGSLPGVPSPGQQALLDALEAEMRTDFADEDQIQEKQQQARKALDNRRRNRRSRPKKK